jgi:hypothetical protein
VTALNGVGPVYETDNERVRSSFLLGSLDTGVRDQVVDRLAAEPASFEEMAATEDDLIIKWHCHQLPAEERSQFAAVYLTSTPRHARVDDILVLLEEAEAWTDRDDRLWNNRLVSEDGSVTTAARWLAMSFGAPRLVWAVVLLATYAVGHRTRQVNSVQSPSSGSGRRVLFGSALVAAGEKGPWPAQGFDRLRIPPDTADIQLLFAVAMPTSGERFEADLQSVDDGPVAQPSPPVFHASPTGGLASVTVPAPPDGDYVLRLRRVAGGNLETVATKTFRVTRWPAAGKE